MKRVCLSELPVQSVSHNPEIQKQVILRSGELPHLVQFAQARFAPGQVAPAHHHLDLCEVFLVTAGTGVMRVDQVDHLLKPGICIAVEPGEQHEIHNSGGEDLMLTYFGLKV